MKILKVLKSYGFLQLVRTETIYGGNYAVINGDRAKTGLNLEAANDLFITLKKLSK